MRTAIARYPCLNRPGRRFLAPVAPVALAVEDEQAVLVRKEAGSPGQEFLFGDAERTGDAVIQTFQTAHHVDEDEILFLLDHLLQLHRFQGDRQHFGR